MSKIELTCVGCDEVFTRYRSAEKRRVKRGCSGPYCSPGCARRSERNRLTRKCGHCGEAFTRSASSILRAERGGGTAYCSQGCHYAARTRPPSERFDEKWVQDGECRRWVAATSRNDDRHGAFNFDGSKVVYAHAFAFFRDRGRWAADGMEIHHTCGNGWCVNPAHLQELSRREHMEVDGRLKSSASHLPHHRGEKHHATKMTRAQVIQLRKRYRAGESRSAIAAEYGIHPDSVTRIASGRTWGHVTAGLVQP